jgi:hypothetical protein
LFNIGQSFLALRFVPCVVKKLPHFGHRGVKKHEKAFIKQDCGQSTVKKLANSVKTRYKVRSLHANGLR